MENQPIIEVVESSTIQKLAAKVLHIVMGPDHPLASHGDHFVDSLPISE